MLTISIEHGVFVRTSTTTLYFYVAIYTVHLVENEKKFIYKTKIKTYRRVQNATNQQMYPVSFTENFFIR